MRQYSVRARITSAKRGGLGSEQDDFQYLVSECLYDHEWIQNRAAASRTAPRHLVGAQSCCSLQRPGPGSNYSGHAFTTNSIIHIAI